MSIYDLAEELLRLCGDDMISCMSSTSIERFIALIDDDDTYAAERIRAIIQNYLPSVEEVDDDTDDENYWDEFEENDKNVEERFAETEELNSIDEKAIKIIDIYDVEIEDDPVLENIKNIVFEYFDSEEPNCPHQKQVNIAHRVLEIFNNR